MGLKKYALAVLLFLLPAFAFAGTPAAQITNTATVTADNQISAGDGVTTISTPVTAAPVPTLSSVGLAALAVLVAGFGVVRMRQSRRA